MEHMEWSDYQRKKKHEKGVDTSLAVLDREVVVFFPDKTRYINAKRAALEC